VCVINYFSATAGLLVMTDDSLGIITLYSSVDPVSRQSYWRE